MAKNEMLIGLDMLENGKYTIILTDEQITKRKARLEAINALEYNSMCYNCKSFKKSCNGSKNKIYGGCIYREVDQLKKSIYVQILEEAENYKREIEKEN